MESAEAETPAASHPSMACHSAVIYRVTFLCWRHTALASPMRLANNWPLLNFKKKDSALAGRRSRGVRQPIRSKVAGLIPSWAQIGGN